MTSLLRNRAQANRGELSADTGFEEFKRMVFEIAPVTSEIAVQKHEAGEWPAVERRRDVPAAGRQGIERRRRRRGNVEQGRALEALGHAVEYLIDSRMFLAGNDGQKAQQDAVQILMRMSRTVFLECPEVVSIWERMDGLCRRSFGRGVKEAR